MVDTPNSYQIRYRVKGTSRWTQYGRSTFNLSEIMVGLRPNTTYQLEVVATDSQGAVASHIIEFTTSTRAPSAPGTPVPGTITLSSIVINWNPSGSGSGTILYQPMYRVHGAGNLVPFGPPLTGTSVIFTGLTAFTEYDIVIVATNSAGSATSPQVVVRTLSAGSAPAPPTAVSVSNVGQNGLTLTWVASVSGTLPISYQPQYRLHGATLWTNYGPTLTTLTANITGLTPSGNYDFTVSAVNSVGTTQAASFINQILVAAPIAPSAPGAPVATNITGSGATLTWTASTTGTPPLDYQVQTRPTGSGQAFGNFGAPTTGLTANLTGLAGGSLYDVRIAVSNAANVPAFSSTLSLQTLAPAVSPPAPISLQVTNVTETGFTFSWAASVGGTAPITYQPKIKPHTGGATANIGSPISGTSVAVTGLTAGTQYDLSVSAINAAAPGGVLSAIFPATTQAAAIPGQVESVSGTTVNNATDIIYASKTPGVAQAAPPYDQWTLTTSATPGNGLQVTRNAASGGGGGSPRDNLISYLHSIAGNHVLSGQVSHADSSEINADRAVLGFDVAIAVYDPYLVQWAGNYIYDVGFEAAALAWADAGGIVGIELNLPSPALAGSSQDLAGANATQILQAGTAQHNQLLAFLDRPVPTIQKFKDAGKPVLFRVLWELDGGWFWWGTAIFSPTQVIQLYRFIHDYYVITKGFDHLVWLWSANGGPGTYMDRYPGDNYVDMLGIDAYTDTLAATYAGVYGNVRSLAPSKLFGLTEWGSGDPGAVNTSFNAQLVINDIKSTLPLSVIVVAWSGWNWSQITNPIGALNDPYVLNRGEFTIQGSAVDTSTRQVIQLYYDNHTIYHESQFGNALGYTPGWWRWTGTAWVDNEPPIGQVESLEATTLTGAGSSILSSRQQGVASAGPFDVWGLNGSQQVLRNGTITPASSGETAPTSVPLITQPGQTFTTNTGAVITLTAEHTILQDGVLLPGSQGSSAAAFDTTTNTLYGQDQTSLAWFSWDGSNWNPSSWTPASVSPPSTTPGVRNWYDIPFASSSFWNCGIGSQATWTTSGAAHDKLRQLNGGVESSEWGVPIYIGDATDPFITFTNDFETADMSPQHFHCPIGATPPNQEDKNMSFFDKTQPGRMWSGWNCRFVNGTNVVDGILTGLSAAGNAFGDGIEVFDSTDPLLATGYMYGAGVISDYDINVAGAINHMLRIALSIDALRSPGSNWRENIPWPGFKEDYNGPTLYTGPITACSTIGIPASTTLTGRGLSTGGLMLATAFQKYGALVRDSTGTNQINCYTTKALAGNARINEMNADMHIIVPLLAIMTNQSSNGQDGRINGGGTYPTPLPPVTGALPGANGAVDELYYHNHSLYAHLSTGWVVWLTATSAFASSADPHIAPSVDGATINSINGTLYDDTVPISAWTLTQSSGQGLQVTRDGHPDTSATQVILMLWYNHRIYYNNSQGGWWYYDRAQANVPRVSAPGDPRVVGTAAVTDITLSNNSITAGLPAGTVVGNISVTMSPGATFTGVINQPSGASGASFSTTGNQLKTAGPLTAGSYVITLATNLLGVTFSKNFTIDVTPSTQSASIAVGTTTGKVLTRDTYGASTGADARNSFNQLMSTPGLQSLLSNVKLGLIRISAAELVAMRYATGTTGIMDNWYNTLAAQIMLPNYNMIMGVGGPINGDSAATPAQHATWAASFATAMRNAGHEITRWEIGNEADLLGLPSYISYFNAIADALRGVNPNYLIGGPVTTRYGAFDTKALVAGVTSQRLGFLSVHSFEFPVNPTDNAATYAYANNTMNAAALARADLAGTGADSIPIMVAGNLGPLTTGAELNESFAGMVGLALLITKYFKTDTLGKLWFGVADLYYSGASQFTGDVSEITPQGYYIAAAAVKLPGNQVSVTNNMTNVDILATVNGKNFAIQLINYDLSATKTANLAIAGGVVTGTITRWEMGKTSGVTPLIGTASLAAVSLPSESIVILTGTLQ